MVFSTLSPASAADFSHLGRDLTPAGAETAGNASRTIPAFEGNQPPNAGWSFGAFRGDYWKHKGEKPLFTITAANMSQYADHLTAGQIAMLTDRKGYQMDVYSSHRDCGLPDFVVKSTLANAGKATIGSDGWGLKSAILPSVPFPIPQSGIEAMWNFQTRYQGLATNWLNARSYVSPRPGSSDGILLQYTQLFYYPWAKQGQQTPGDVGQLQNGTFYSYSQPNALAGQALMQRYYFNSSAESYYYFTGQRRVRRLPTYAYDAPIIGFENQYPNDAIQVFYGSPDRFDWKLAGKREIYIPYNSFETTNYKLGLDMLGPQYVSSKVRRYELHRVWVLEGTVKEGMRHTTPHKTLYLDEDSWIAAVGDDYDSDKRLWRMKEMFSYPDYEAQSCTSSGMLTINDVIGGRYVADQVLFGTGADVRQELTRPQDNRLKDDFYTPENLRAISER